MNSSVVKVELSRYEMEMACQVALRRQIDAEWGGMRDRVNDKTFTEGLRAHVLGCMGELAFARFLGIYWNGSVGTFSSIADLGNAFEVRHRSKHDWDLIVRRRDSHSSIYLLSTGDSKDILLHGGMEGKFAKSDRFLKSYGGKGEAYFIPSDELTLSPEQLRESCMESRSKA